MGVCVKCGGPLGADGEGATRKFVNRGAEEFYCLDCLAAGLKVSRALLEEKIADLRERGCTLFPK